MADLKGIIKKQKKSMSQIKGYTWMTLNKIIFSHLYQKENQFCLNVTVSN